MAAGVAEVAPTHGHATGRRCQAKRRRRRLGRENYAHQLLSAHALTSKPLRRRANSGDAGLLLQRKCALKSSNDALARPPKRLLQRLVPISARRGPTAHAARATNLIMVETEDLRTMAAYQGDGAKPHNGSVDSNTPTVPRGCAARTRPRAILCNREHSRAAPACSFGERAR